jgi:PAS domain S-box-containing protein
MVLSALAVLLFRRRGRVEMEGALRTNTLLATLIDHLPDMVFVKNKKGLYVVTNRTHSRFHGANSEEDFLGKTSQEVLPMDLARRITVADDKVLAEGHVLIEEEEQSRDTWGNTRWLSTTRVPLRDGGGRVIGMVGISRDITERKAAEQRLIHLNRVHAMVTDINQAMVRIRDRQTLLQEACRITVEDGQMRMACVVLPERERMVKIGAFAGVEGGFFDAVLRGDPTCSGWSAALEHVLREGQREVCNDIEHDARLVGWRQEALKRGYCSMAVFPLHSGERVVAAFVLFAHAVGFFDTEELLLLDGLAVDLSFAMECVEKEEWRQRAEMALEENERMLSTLMSNLPGMAYRCRNDLNWTMEFLSDGCLELTGYPASDLHQNRRIAFGQLIHPDDRQRVWDYVQAALEGRKVFQLEYRIVAATGSHKWVWEKGLGVYSPEGNLMAIEGFVTDITERKELEGQLRQSQKMEAIGRLAGGVAHDFNNILAVIRGNAELVLMGEGRAPGDPRECVKQIVAAADRAANLTRQLLAFGRKQVLQPRLLDLRDLVNNLSKMLKRIIGEDVELQYRYASQIPLVQGDAGMIEQIVVNLAVNARDAMPQGGKLVISTRHATFGPSYTHSHPEARAGSFVGLSVSDTGCGIAPEHLPRIFEPFFTTKDTGKGTGLGLATVYGIVRQHHGWIDVVSQVGNGTTFEVFLPSTEGHLAPPSPPLPPPPPPRGGNERVLLVEDDETVRALTRRVLESFGYRVMEAATGKEALERWPSKIGEIDLLLTDVIMPQGVSGGDLAEQLRKLRPGLKVIFISGYGGAKAKRLMESLPPPRTYFLQKPCTPQDLLHTIRQCLDEP